MKTFLFQGDSITDAGRSHDRDDWMGSSYPTITAGILNQFFPGEIRFLNRGESGNKSIDLYARMKEDCIRLKPDFISVLIGVNDVWHEISHGTGCNAQQFEWYCRRFYERVLTELPGVQILVLEPFVTKGSLYDGERWNTFRSAVEINASISAKLAREYNLAFIPLQRTFDLAASTFGPEAVTIEGVHPTQFGHSIIAKALVQEFEERMTATI